MTKSRMRSTFSSISFETCSPVLVSYSGQPSRSSTRFKPSCLATTPLGSARTPSHGIPVRRLGSSLTPVTIDAPRSTGALKVSESVYTRPPTRSRASRTTTSQPCRRSIVAAARPAGPAPITIVGRASTRAGRDGISAIVIVSPASSASSSTSANSLGLAKNFSIVSRMTGLNSFNPTPMRASSL